MPVKNINSKVSLLQPLSRSKLPNLPNRVSHIVPKVHGKFKQKLALLFSCNMSVLHLTLT